MSVSEFNSAEEAGGKSIGLSGKIRGYNADVEARLADVLMQVGRWVERESGALMGHIKMAVTNGEQTLTMNLTDMDEGVLYHGKIRPSKTVDFSFMAAVLDVDDHELEHRTLHAFEDSGVMMDIDGKSSSHHHHHHDGEECHCHDHDHEHGEHCTCGCHDNDHDHEHHHHHDGEECHCHDHDHHDHDHEHHHHDGECCHHHHDE